MIKTVADKCQGSGGVYKTERIFTNIWHGKLSYFQHWMFMCCKNIEEEDKEEGEVSVESLV